jgi:hypothetical protein
MISCGHKIPNSYTIARRGCQHGVTCGLFVHRDEKARRA